MANLGEVITRVYQNLSQNSSSTTFDRNNSVIPKINDVQKRICRGTIKNLVTSQLITSGDLRFLRKEIPITYVESKTITADITPNTTTVDVSSDGFSDCLDIEQTQQNSSAITGQTIGLTFIEQSGQTFIAPDDNVVGISFYKKADTGTFVGDVVFSIYGTVNNEPSSTLIGTSTLTNAEWIALADDEEFRVNIEAIGMVKGGTYAITVSTTTADDSNYINLGLQNTNVYRGGNYIYKENGSWVQGMGDLYFKTFSYRYCIIMGNVIKYTGVDTDQITGVSDILTSLTSGTTIEQVYKIPPNAWKAFQLFRPIKNTNYGQQMFELPYQDFRFPITKNSYFTVLGNDSSLKDQFVYIRDWGYTNGQLYWLYFYSDPDTLTNDSDELLIPDPYALQVLPNMVAGELMREVEEDQQSQRLLTMGYGKLVEMYQEFAKIVKPPKQQVKYKPVNFRGVSGLYNGVIN